MIDELGHDPSPPPADDALPALPTAFRGAAMQEIVDAALGDAVVVRGCVPTYVRYKPGTTCIVQYRLRLEDADSGTPEETLAHVKLYAGGRAARVWARAATQELAATARDWSDGDRQAERAALLPELDAVLQLFPVDTAIPALAVAASARGGRRVLAELGEFPGPDHVGPVLLRSKPARKALLRYETSTGALYAKLYAGDEGRRILQACRALVAAGVPTAAPVAYLPDRRLLAHEAGRGTPLCALAGADLVAGLRAAGQALAQLHGAPLHAGSVAGLRRHGLADEAAAVLAGAQAIGAVCPGLADDASELAARTVAALGAIPPESTVIHGDFYDDQMLVDGDVATLIDLDRIASGHPLIDVANGLAHLAADGSGGAARDAFLDGYGPVPSGVVAALEAAALLRLAIAPFRRMEPGWCEGVERHLDLAAARLDAAPGSRPSGMGRPVDPAMPQLAVGDASEPT